EHREIHSQVLQVWFLALDRTPRTSVADIVRAASPNCHAALVRLLIVNHVNASFLLCLLSLRLVLNFNFARRVGLSMAVWKSRSARCCISASRQWSVPLAWLIFIDEISAIDTDHGGRGLAGALLCGDQRGHAESNHHVNFVCLLFLADAPTA